MTRLFKTLLACSLPFAALHLAKADDTPLTAMPDPQHTVRAIFPPAELEQRHFTGEAHLRCTITPEGIAQSCQILSATTPDFGLAAQNAALTSRFLPQYNGTTPQSATWDHTYRFTLEHKPNLTSGPILDEAHSPRLQYPEIAALRNLKGTIHIACTIDTQGIAHQCETTAAVPPELEPLRLITLAHYALARYTPAIENGHPTESRIQQAIDWQGVDPSDDQPGFR